jgi:hypothetical protein
VKKSSKPPPSPLHRALYFGRNPGSWNLAYMAREKSRGKTYVSMIALEKNSLFSTN